MSCGNDCNVVSDVEVSVTHDPPVLVPPHPKGKPPDLPTDDQIKAAVKKKFEQHMKGGCDEKQCECVKKKSDEKPTEIDHTKDPRGFTVYFPDAGAPTPDHPQWKVTGKVGLKYKIVPGICEPNLNVG